MGFISGLVKIIPKLLDRQVPPILHQQSPMGCRINHNTLHINDAILYYIEGIDETAQETYSVVNPINDFLSINFNKTGDYNIILTDLRGAVIVNTHVNQVSQFSLNTADLKSGSYLLTVNGQTKHLIK